VVVIEPEDRNPVANVLSVALFSQAREQVVEAFQSILESLVHPLDEVLQLGPVDVVLQPRPPAGLGIPDTSVRPSVHIGFLPYLILSSLRKRYASGMDWLYVILNATKHLNPGSNATQTHAFLPLILIIVSSTNIAPTSLLSRSNPSQIGAKRWTHWRIASWDLSTSGSRILDALLKLFEQR
jgi:hypothetical protein